MFKTTQKSKHSSFKRITKLIIAAMMGFGLLLPILPASAQKVTQLRISKAEMGATQYLQVGHNKSVIIDLPAEVGEVIVSQPNVAGVVMRSKRRAILQGVGVGETNIFFLDARGAKISVLEVSVVADASGLAKTISSILPGAKIKIESFGDRLVLSGTVRSGDDMEKAIAIAAQFAGGEDNVANIIKVEGAQQVMLKVTIAEVGRETVKQLGINLSGSFGTGSLSTSMISVPSLGGASNVVPPNTVSASVGIGNLAISATLRALERRGALRTLAEPTLSALSGQTAEFLVGGEFPVPVGIDNGQILFEFKEFGVDLKFTPTVKSNGIIALVVDVKVSEPTTEGGFNAGGITIPATRSRQAKTTVELRTGTTMAIAGLIEEKVRAQMNSMPGIGNLPILGALFRSRDFIRSETELLILVTPVLAVAGGPINLPTDKMVFAGDAEAVFLGRIEKLYGVGSSNNGNYQGSIGFVLD
ncbi:MAG: type II and III secretion system protein family protein [Devosiaceae bacterium]|nr:type II and III secretion system protein family protein [Devosiaceae bacterium]